MQRFVALVLLGTFLCALVPPVYTDTTTTVPPTTQPETTVPPTTLPETTVPPTTQTETTVPPTTQPETTVPPTTQTETTGPPTTLPETTVPPTTQPKSTALPTVTPKEINVTVVDEGKACLIATMEAALTITYEKTDNTSVKRTLPIPQPKTVPGRCASAKNPSAEFTLAFDGIELRLTFSQKDGVAYLETAVLNYTLDEANFPHAKIPGQKVSERADLKLRLAKTTEFFQCKSPIVEAIGKTSTITFDTLKIQVFNVVNGTYSKDKGMCPQDAPTGPPTTAAPTTAPPKPTTTPKPSPPAKPLPGNWTVEGKDGVICVVLHLGVRFTINYEKTDSKMANAMVDLPKTANSTGTCGNVSDTIILSFFKDKWSLELIFDQTSTTQLGATNEYALDNITLKYVLDEKRFPGAKDQGSKMVAVASNLQQFKTAAGNAFTCTSKIDLKLSNNVTLDTTDMKVQAFKSDNSTTFAGGNEVCKQDLKTSSIVPIAVGAALAALVVIVLIAYVIGRRKKYSGYEAL